LRKRKIAAQRSAMAAAKPMAMPTYADVVRLLSGGGFDAAAVVVGEGLLLLATESDVLLVDVLLVDVVVVAVVLELEGKILV
jgi:hypothetical protein